jgi:transketolase
MIGGFGSSVTDLLIEKLGTALPPLVRIGLPDAFPHKYGLQEELFEVYGLAAGQIAGRVVKSLKLKEKVA